MAAPLLTAALLSTSVLWGSSPVQRVEFSTPGLADVGELRTAFGVVPGKPISRSAIRAGVQALIATGKVEDVVVTVEPDASGTVVIVRTQLTSRVDTVRVSGLPRSLRRQVLQTLALARGRHLQVDAFERALLEAQAELRSDGYTRAVLEPDLTFDLEHGTVAITIAAALHEPRVLRGLRVAGAEISAAEALEACELTIGKRLGDGNLEGARRRLAEHVRRQGWWEADVAAPRLEMDGNDATVTLEVTLGRKYRLDLVGLEDTNGLEQDALPFLTGRDAFAEAAVDAMVAATRVELQRQGYLLARATGSLDTTGDERVLHLVVDRGEKTPIVAVRFPGGEAIPAEELEERIGAFHGRSWRWGREPVDELTLAVDATSVQATLQERGYADAVVEEPRVVPEGKGVAIELPVRAGPRKTVSDVTLTGMPEGFVVPKLPLVKDRPWSLLAQEEARVAVEVALQDAGFGDAEVTVKESCTRDTCAVHLDAVSGERIVIDRVIIAGLERTRRGVVESATGLKAGQTLGPTRLLDIQRSLLGLGIFNEVRLAPLPGQESGSRRGLLVSATEGPSRALSFGAGWDTERKAQLSVTWSELSLFGTGRSLTFDGRFSSQELRWQVSYREPARLGLLRVPSAVSIFRTEEHNPDYDLLRRGMWIDLGDRLKRPNRGFLRYDYQITEPDAPPEVLSELEREDQEARIASLTPTFEHDTRDDLFTPRKGTYLSLSYQRSFKLFQADALFDKVVGVASAFMPFAGGTLAVNSRVGYLSSRSGTQQPAPAPIDVPIAVRFYAGGRISHRAFPTDRLGIPGKTLDAESGESIGGGGLVLANLEWRFAVYGPVGANVFVDGGNVWREFGDIHVADMRWGAGVGVRVETPVGPLRLEYGWKLDERIVFRDGTQESAGELFVSFGNPF